MFVGPIPEGMLVLHSCDNPRCVNPVHLRVGTVSDNASDREQRGLGSRKLSTEQVQMIRAGLPAREALAKFGIASCTYYLVRNGKRYREVSA